jgi:hypothetical protein
MSGLLFILLLLVPVQSGTDYPLKNGRPTSKGIDQYVEDNAEALTLEFEAFIKDTLYNTNIYTEDLSENGEHNPIELGNYYPNEIFITNAEVFLAYELDDLPRKSRESMTSSNLFVKAAVYHELAHHYIYQVSIEMLRQDQIRVDRAYQSFFRIYSYRDNPGEKFIEEGICEYINGKTGEIIVPRRPHIPKKLSELNDPEKEYQVFYKYAAYYLTGFLDTNGLKRGIKILLHNPPPSAREILEPDLFFSRLEGID